MKQHVGSTEIQEIHKPGCSGKPKKL